MVSDNFFVNIYKFLNTSQTNFFFIYPDPQKYLLFLKNTLVTVFNTSNSAPNVCLFCFATISVFSPLKVMVLSVFISVSVLVLTTRSSSTKLFKTTVIRNRFHQRSDLCFRVFVLQSSKIIFKTNRLEIKIDLSRVCNQMLHFTFL